MSSPADETFSGQPPMSNHFTTDLDLDNFAQPRDVTERLETPSVFFPSYEEKEVHEKLNEIQQAVCANDATTVSRLLDHGVSANDGNPSPLALAAERGLLDMMQMLLSHDATPVCLTDDDDSPLARAARAGQEPALILLLQYDQRSLLDRFNALLIAIDLDKKVEVLASEEKILHYENSYGHQALHRAVMRKNIPVIQKLISMGAPLRSPRPRWTSPLHYAVMEGAIDIVTILITEGSDCNALTDKGGTPLGLAAEYDHDSIVMLLLRNGAKIDLQMLNGMTALMVAARTRRLSIVDKLLQAGADPEILENTFGYTALTYAIGGSSLDIAKCLLRSGMSLSYVDATGRSYLHYAAMKGDPQIIEALIEGGCSVHATDSRGCTPIFYAVLASNEVNISTLLKKGANPDHQTQLDGATPLILACSLGNEIASRRLIEAGASQNLTANDSENSSAFDVAIKNGRIEIALMLMQSRKDLRDAALTMAVYANKYDMVVAFLEHGLRGSDYHEPPLNVAAMLHSAEIAGALARHGAAVDQMDNMGMTAAAWAQGHDSTCTRIGRSEVERVLVSCDKSTAREQYHRLLDTILDGLLQLLPTDLKAKSLTTLRLCLLLLKEPKAVERVWQMTDSLSTEQDAPWLSFFCARCEQKLHQGHFCSECPLMVYCDRCAGVYRDGIEVRTCCNHVLLQFLPPGGQPASQSDRESFFDWMRALRSRSRMSPTGIPGSDTDLVRIENLDVVQNPLPATSNSVPLSPDLSGSGSEGARQQRRTENPAGGITTANSNRSDFPIEQVNHHSFIAISRYALNILMRPLFGIASFSLSIVKFAYTLWVRAWSIWSRSLASNPSEDALRGPHGFPLQRIHGIEHEIPPSEEDRERIITQMKDAHRTSDRDPDVQIEKTCWLVKALVLKLDTSSNSRELEATIDMIEELLSCQTLGLRRTNEMRRLLSMAYGLRLREFPSDHRDVFGPKAIESCIKAISTFERTDPDRKIYCVTFAVNCLYFHAESTPGVNDETCCQILLEAFPTNEPFPAIALTFHAPDVGMNVVGLLIRKLLVLCDADTDVQYLYHLIEAVQQIARVEPLSEYNHILFQAYLKLWNHTSTVEHLFKAKDTLEILNEHNTVQAGSYFALGVQFHGAFQRSQDESHFAISLLLLSKDVAEHAPAVLEFTRQTSHVSQVPQWWYLAAQFLEECLSTRLTDGWEITLPRIEDQTASNITVSFEALMKAAMWWAALYYTDASMKQLAIAIHFTTLAANAPGTSQAQYIRARAAQTDFLISRCERSRSQKDADRVVDQSREILALVEQCEERSESRGLSLVRLVGCLFFRYEAFHKPSDLKEALRRNGAAVESGLLDNVWQATQLVSQACMLMSSFKKTKEPRDIDNARTYARRAAGLGAEDSPTYQQRLGSFQQQLFLNTTSSEDLDAFVAVAKKIVNTPGHGPVFRMLYARVLVDCLALAGKYDEAVPALDTFLELLPEISSAVVESLGSKFTLLFDGMPDTLGSVLAEAGRDPFETLVSTEAVRGIEIRSRLGAWNKAQPLVRPREDHASFAPENKLATPTVPSGSPQTYQRLSEMMSMMLDDLRPLPPFGGHDRGTAIQADILEFNQVLNHSELIRLATPMTIVTFAIGVTSSKAIAATSNGVRYILLDGLRKQDLQASVNRFHGPTKVTRGTAQDTATRNSEMKNILTWLWQTTVHPILRELSLCQEGLIRDLPRVCWVASGLMGALPLHAAGDFSHGQGPCTMDYVISSYTASIKCLRFARHRATSVTAETQSSAVVVAMSNPAGHQTLVSIDKEIDAFKHCFRQARSLAQQNKADVLNVLGSDSVVHLLCHTDSESDRPFETALLVNQSVEEAVKLGDLRTISNPRAQLAYLSACSSAANVSEEYLDEALHLVCGFQLIGFPHVVGTMWDADNEASVQIAALFHANLSKHSGDFVHGPTVAKALHDATITYRDQSPWLRGNVLGWAPYIHFGC